MKLTRHTTPDGRCKYAIVRMDKLRTAERVASVADLNWAPRLVAAQNAVKILNELNLIEFSEPGSREESFTLKLKDQFAAQALRAYRDEVLAHMNAIHPNNPERLKWEEYASDLGQLIDRSEKLERNLPSE